MLSRIVQVDVFNDVLPKYEGDDDVIAYVLSRNYFSTEQDARDSGVEPKKFRYTVRIDVEEIK